jgi:plastocyanin
MSSAVSACDSDHTAGPTVVISGNPLGNPDSLYKPSAVRITTGETVTWVDHDDSIHTVTPNVSSSGWSGGSSYLHRGQRYSFEFKRAGTYRYHCMVHPNMLGVVIVSGSPKS